MSEAQIRFEDGAAYERMMGVWSGLAGELFLAWLAPAKGLRWIDIGCGAGAFTQRLVDGAAPAQVCGVDPSAAQLAFARTRPAARLAEFHEGHAMALPFADKRFDAAVMALVIFFVPDPAKGLAEMVRVVKSGGLVAAYAWDIPGGGLPGQAIADELYELCQERLLPPSFAISRIEALRDLWAAAGLEGVATREIVVSRSFADFEEYWALNLASSRIAPLVARLSAEQCALLKARVRTRLPADTAGRITEVGRANAVKGRVPV